MNEKIIIEDFFIEEKEYQEIKKQLNKENDYFNIKEIILISDLSKTCPVIQKNTVNSSTIQ